MAILASDVITAASTLLNDPNKVIFTDTVLLAHVKKAVRDLSNALALNEINTVQEITAAITVPAGTVSLVAAALQPADLLEVTEIEERAVGGTLYTSMIKAVVQLPERDKVDTLIDWIWEEEEVKFVGANTDRQIRMHYVKSLAAVTSTSSVIGVAGSLPYLESRVAALAALINGGNATLAQALQEDADLALAVLLGIGVKDNQAVSVRRKMYTYLTRRRR